MDAKDNKPLRIVIAEDDPDDRYFISLAFKEARAGHHIDFVKDGRELIEHLQHNRSALPDLVLLDLNMPRLDGRSALKEIRSDAQFSELSIVILSTCISDSDKQYTASFGVMRHVVKPFDFAELVHVIKYICSLFTASEPV